MIFYNFKQNFFVEFFFLVPVFLEVLFYHRVFCLLQSLFLILFSGDCLFLAGCGRLLEGTAEQLYNSLDKVKALPPQTKVYFGHNYNLNNLKFALSVEPKNQKLVARYDAENKKQKNISACCQTTIQKELETNPFLRLNSKEISNSIAEKIGRKAENTLDLFTQLRYLKDKF